MNNYFGWMTPYGYRITVHLLVERVNDDCCFRVRKYIGLNCVAERVLQRHGRASVLWQAGEHRGHLARELADEAFPPTECIGQGDAACVPERRCEFGCTVR